MVKCSTGPGAGNLSSYLGSSHGLCLTNVDGKQVVSRGVGRVIAGAAVGVNSKPPLRRTEPGSVCVHVDHGVPVTPMYVG